MIGVLLVISGCNETDTPEVEADVNEPATQVSDEPQVLSPLEMLPKEPAQEPAEQDKPVDSVESEDSIESAAPNTGDEINTAAINAIHKIARRSAFPNQGEAITQPIAAKRLSEESQFLEPIDEGNIPDIVPWTEAKRYLGYVITVEGKIVEVGQSRNGKVSFLNFHQDWRGKFYMVVFDDLAKTLDASVEEVFRGKTLRVTGEVENHRGWPQIKILSMDQVEIVGE